MLLNKIGIIIGDICCTARDTYLLFSICQPPLDICVVRFHLNLLESYMPMTPKRPISLCARHPYPNAIPFMLMRLRHPILPI